MEEIFITGLPCHFQDWNEKLDDLRKSLHERIDRQFEFERQRDFTRLTLDLFHETGFLLFRI